MKAWIEQIDRVELSNGKNMVKMCRLVLPGSDWKVIIDDLDLQVFTELIMLREPAVRFFGGIRVMIFPQIDATKVALSFINTNDTSGVLYYNFDIEEILQQYAPQKVNPFLKSLKK